MISSHYGTLFARILWREWNSTDHSIAHNLHEMNRRRNSHTLELFLLRFPFLSHSGQFYLLLQSSWRFMETHALSLFHSSIQTLLTCARSSSLSDEMDAPEAGWAMGATIRSSLYRRALANYITVLNQQNSQQSLTSFLPLRVCICIALLCRTLIHTLRSDCNRNLQRSKINYLFTGFNE